MLDLIINAVLLVIAAGLLYCIYVIPPVRRRVDDLASKYRDFFFSLLFGLFVAAVMYFVVLPRI